MKIPNLPLAKVSILLAVCPLLAIFSGNLQREQFSAHTADMKLTTLICCSYLIAFGIAAAVYALTGFPLLSFLCAGNETAVRALLSLTGVCALWLLFWLLAFRPTRFLS